MTEALEIRTPHTDVSQVVRELAPGVDDLSIRLPCQRTIADGEWVRFSVLLADGSTVFEGIGRSQGTRAEGPRYRVHLSLLQFDERNEILYERMLLARDAAEETGTIDLNEMGAELLRGPARSAPPPPPRKSAPPTSSKLSTPAPPRPSTPPARTSTRPVAPPPRASSLPPPPSKAPMLPARPLPAASLKPSAPARAATPARPQRAVAGGAADALAPTAAPAKRRRTTRVPVEERAEVPSLDTVVSRQAPPDRESALRLEVSPHMVARARALAPTLPSGMIDASAPPEEAVLRTALRIGLAALAGLDDDE